MVVVTSLGVRSLQFEPRMDWEVLRVRGEAHERRDVKMLMKYTGIFSKWTSRGYSLGT